MTTEYKFLELEEALSPENSKEQIARLRAIPAIAAFDELGVEQSKGNLLDPIVRVDKILVRTEPGGFRVTKKRGVLSRRRGVLGKKATNARKSIEFIDRKYADGGVNEKTGLDFAKSKNAPLIAWKVIKKLSPQLTGQYADSHEMFYNGKFLRPGSISAQLLTTNDSVIFVNSMPYAKRLEGVRYSASRSIQGNILNQRGESVQRKVRKRPRDVTPQSSKYMSKRAPNGIYNMAAAKINRQFKGLVKAQFTYLPVSMFYGRRYSGSRIVKPEYDRKGKKDGRPTVFPAIILTLDNASGLAPTESQGPFNEPGGNLR